jgi:hypothetical protein
MPRPVSHFWASHTSKLQGETRQKITFDCNVGWGWNLGSFYAYIAQKDTKVSAQTIDKIQSYLMPCLVSHFWASIKTAMRVRIVRQDAAKNNFWSPCWLELKLWDPFTHRAQKDPKVLAKPYRYGRYDPYLMPHLASHYFRLSVKTAMRMGGVRNPCISSIVNTQIKLMCIMGHSCKHKPCFMFLCTKKHRSISWVLS